MRKKNNNDVLMIVNSFQKIIQNKPTPQEMLEEVRMMSFKIRPVQGDISIIDFKNDNLIEVLWSLGKLEDFFYKQSKKLSPKKRELLYRVYQDFSKKYQNQLNGLSLHRERLVNQPVNLEMEIFKERPRSKKNN